MRAMKDSGVEWIGEIPERWKIIRTKSVFSHHKTIVGKKSSEYQRLALTLMGVIPRSKDDSTGLQPEEFNNYQVLEAGNLVFKLIDLVNVSTSRVGFSPFTGIVSPAYIILTPTPNTGVKFYYYHFYSMWQREIFNHMGDDGVRSALNSKDLLNIPLPCPPPAEQQRIATYLDEQCGEIDKVLAKTRESIEEYKKLKQSVITEAVTQGIRPDRPMKPSGIEWIGDIPEEWGIRRLRHLGCCQNGISKGAEFFGSGYPFVSYSDVYKNMELPRWVNGLVESTDEERERYSVLHGDIFFTRTSETIEEIGFTAVCLNTIPNATFAGFLIRVRPTTSLITPEFSKYYFRSDSHRCFFVKEMNLVTRASLGQELLKKLPVLLPPLDEQQEIVAYLDQQCAEIDRLIAKKEQIITELEGYKKSLIYECVTGKREVE